MDSSELTSYIRMCASHNKNSSIKIDEDSNLFSLALNLIINKSSKSLKLIIIFQQNVSRHPLLELLNEPVVIKNTLDFLALKGSDMHIFTNEQKKVRSSTFYKNLSKMENGLKLRAIPKKYNKKLSENMVDIVIGDKNYVLIGTNRNGQSNYFVNFGDENGHVKLTNLFEKLASQLSAGDVDND